MEAPGPDPSQHVDVHAGDDAASVLHETVLRPLGVQTLSSHEDGDGHACFARVNVVDPRPPTTGLHLCFRARWRDAVDGSHGAGVEAGPRSNGKPGHRAYAAGDYAAYPLDADDNDVEALDRDVGNPGHEG